MPKVSLVMATYNDSPQYLNISITSIVNQTFKDWELIIVDDSDDDKIIKIIDQWGKRDSRIVIARNSQHKFGFVAALNYGLEKATGQYIGRMDSDDISYPERIEKEVKYLDEYSNIDVVGTQTAIINENGERTSSIRFPTTGFKLRLFQMLRCPMQHGTIMMRRQLIDGGIRYDESFKKSEDLELWLRLQKKGYKLYNIQEILYDFRIEDGYANKRSRKHFRYNVKARLKNFAWQYLLTDLCGLAINSFYYCIPSNLKDVVYNKLNGR